MQFRQSVMTWEKVKASSLKAYGCIWVLCGLLKLPPGHINNHTKNIKRKKKKSWSAQFFFFFFSVTQYFFFIWKGLQLNISGVCEFFFFFFSFFYFTAVSAILVVQFETSVCVLLLHVFLSFYSSMLLLNVIFMILFFFPFEWHRQVSFLINIVTLLK